MTDDANDGGTASWTGGGAAALATYAPDVLASYEELVSVRPSGVHDETLQSPDVAAFAEQLRLDAAGIDERLRARFVRVTDGHSVAVSHMVWISYVAPRIRGALDALFGPSETWPGRRRYPVADTGAVVERFVAAVGQLDVPEADLPDAAKAALALADAMVRTPTAIPDSVVEATHELLTPAQAVAVVLDAARNSAAKIAVALPVDV
jgi:alkylhydroperoxidase family enzyme